MDNIGQSSRPTTEQSKHQAALVEAILASFGYVYGPMRIKGVLCLRVLVKGARS